MDDPLWFFDHNQTDARLTFCKDKANCIKARYGTGGGIRQSYFTIDRASFNQGTNAQYDMKIAEGGGDAYSGSERPSRSRYYMTDRAGHLCRFTLINKCNTLQATDDKDPPVLLTH